MVYHISRGTKISREKLARWSSGQDGGLSRRKREFDSPTGHQEFCLTAVGRNDILDLLQRCSRSKVRVHGDEGTPVPIPNTVVKLINGDNTWLATAREDNTTRTLHSLIAQSVEHAAVNRGVVGSSPTWGAIKTTVAAADQVAANALFIGR